MTMNAQVFSINAPAQKTDLTTSAMLVQVKVRGSTLQKVDKRVSNEVTTAKNANSKAGKFVSNLLADDPDLKALTSYRGVIDHWVKRMTYEWGGGWDLLPNQNYPRLIQEFSEHEKTYNSLADKLCDAYDSKVSDMAFAATGRGDLFNRADYPTKEELRAKFSVELIFMPVPDNDFRNTITHDAVEDCTRSYNNQLKSVIDTVLEKRTELLLDYLERLSHSCGMTEKTKEDGSVILRRNNLHEDTVKGAIALCQEFETFNPSTNAKLEEARQSLQKLLQETDTEKLKKSDAVRHTTKAQIDDILSRFKGE
jgi:hypothetical protein